MAIKSTRGEKVFNVFNIIFMLSVCFLSAYPIWFVIVNSLNEGQDALRGGIYFWPRIFSLENYITVFRDGGVVRAFQVTIARTLLGTILTVFISAMVSYSLSKDHLVFRKLYITLGMITMFFSGGLIPTFLLYRNLGLLDNFLVFIIPGLFGFFNALIFMAFFRGIPGAIEESAKIDGASDFRVFLQIILPLSTPVLATIALFTGVGHWNDYFSGVMFLSRRTDLEPIQTYLYRIVAEAMSNQMQVQVANVAQRTTSASLRFATMVITIVPIICVYPFLQKYFVKGMLIGAVKE